MNKAMKTLCVTLAGLATSLLTAVILYLLERYANFAVYSFMLWFIVPIGAVGAGFVASIGYYAGARILHYRPDRLLLLNIIIVSILSFVGLNYLLYATMTVDGKSVQDYISFPQYLHITISHMTMSSSHSYDTKKLELGMWGYGITAIQILGFAFGGLIVHGMLTSIPYCDRCERYLKTVGSQFRYSEESEEFREKMKEIAQMIEGGQLSGAISAQRAIGSERLAPNHLLRSNLKLETCEQCRQHWLTHTGELKDTSGRQVVWALISGLKARNVTDSTLYL